MKLLKRIMTIPLIILALLLIILFPIWVIITWIPFAMDAIDYYFSEMFMPIIDVIMNVK